MGLQKFQKARVYRWSPFVSVDSHQMLVLVSQLKLLICVTQVEL